MTLADVLTWPLPVPGIIIGCVMAFVAAEIYDRQRLAVALRVTRKERETYAARRKAYDAYIAKAKNGRTEEPDEDEVAELQEKTDGMVEALGHALDLMKRGFERDARHELERALEDAKAA